MNTALVIIDVQNDYFPQGKCELFLAEQALTVTKTLLEYFRTKKFPVFMCNTYHQKTPLFFSQTR